MRKGELIDAMASASELPKTKSREALDAILDSISESLGRGEDVVLPGFGSFKITERKARQGINPLTGAPLDIPARKGVRFKPAASWTQRCVTCRGESSLPERFRKSEERRAESLKC